jgi:hypothetical protein
MATTTTLALGAVAWFLLVPAAVSSAPAAIPAPANALAAAPSAVAAHDACSGPNSPHIPCRFSTPSGNIRCLWTPKPNNVACELLSTGRAYRLRPTGKAQVIKLKLHSRGETLPTSQDIVFPESLSCRDTNKTMTCSQDFGLGMFVLAPKGSHSS